MSLRKELDTYCASVRADTTAGRDVLRALRPYRYGTARVNSRNLRMLAREFALWAREHASAGKGVERADLRASATTYAAAAAALRTLAAAE